MANVIAVTLLLCWIASVVYIEVRTNKIMESVGDKTPYKELKKKAKELETLRCVKTILIVGMGIISAVAISGYKPVDRIVSLF